MSGVGGSQAAAAQALRAITVRAEGHGVGSGVVAAGLACAIPSRIVERFCRRVEDAARDAA